MSQKLSPQQIQLIKLLQIPVAELDKRIEEEIEINPALEEGSGEIFDVNSDNQNSDSDSDGGSDKEDNFDDDYQENAYEDLTLSDYLGDQDIAGYKMQSDGYNGDDEERESPLSGKATLIDHLNEQLGFLPLSETQQIIGLHLVGNIDKDGYIRREIDSIVNDLAFGQNIIVTEDDVLEVLEMIQQFEPAGIGARDLQECLVLQLERKRGNYEVLSLALNILETCFDDFTKKNYNRIIKKLDVEDQELLKDAIKEITRLNPRPGESGSDGDAAQYVIPDFVVTETNGKLELTLNQKNAPELRVSSEYVDMFKEYEKGSKTNKSLKETLSFVKQKLESAKWFIDAIKQRQQTLMLTMGAIVEYQYNFFLSGDESDLRPMVLKDIAERISMDISTVSRVASSKYVQTDFGTFQLKHFFSESITTDSGEDVSNREVKHILKEMIEAEDKRNPFSDDQLEKQLNDKGYNIARRTVAKYREQLHIPVAKLRKIL